MTILYKAERLQDLINEARTKIIHSLEAGELEEIERQYWPKLEQLHKERLAERQATEEE
jgi:hypothetical protein